MHNLNIIIRIFNKLRASTFFKFTAETTLEDLGRHKINHLYNLQVRKYYKPISLVHLARQIHNSTGFLHDTQTQCSVGQMH